MKNEPIAVNTDQAYFAFFSIVGAWGVVLVASIVEVVA